MNDDDDALGTLLSAAAEELPCTSKSNVGEKFLENIPDFPNPSRSKKLQTKVTKSVVTKEASDIHTGETDSSDDEENRYFETRKYDSFGSAIKQMLPASSSTTRNNIKEETTWQTKTKQLSVASAKPQPKTDDVYTDPTFGIRIVNPLVSGSLLQERMNGRVAVSLANLKTHINNLKSETDWVIAGAIVHKSAARTSQKGSSYTIWTLSDLQHDLKTVTLFLFGNAFKQLWKTGTGMVVGVLNPSVLEKNSNTKDEAALSVDNAQRVMILGQSKDLGTCKSTEKNGDRCTAFVNTNHCDFCLYHIKKEYQKCTQKRSELQSTFAGRGLTALRNKVLGKNEVFYAGKSYMAIPAGKNKKLVAKDDRRLKALGNNVMVNAEVTTKVNNLSRRRAAAHLELSANQRAKDLEMLKRLAGGSKQGEGSNNAPFNASVSNEVTLEESKRAAVSVITKLKAAEIKANGSHEIVINGTPSDIRSNTAGTKLIEKQQDNDNAPSLTKSVGGKVDLNAPISRRLVNRAKLNALSWVKQNGPIQKSDANKTRATQGKKRPLNLDGGDDKNGPPSAKQQKIEQNEFFSERFKKIMAISSRHSDLLEQHDNEEEAKYFSKLEKKEQMEEKMLSTYKVQCKAVRCLKCKYTSFSAAELCKVEKHPFKVFDAVKRFFKCGDCKNRTVTLTVVPMAPCGKCGGGKWERAAMLREKEFSAAHCLSIRGGEQTFLNSGLNNANLDLLVPDDK